MMTTMMTMTTMITAAVAAVVAAVAAAPPTTKNNISDDGGDDDKSYKQHNDNTKSQTSWRSGAASTAWTSLCKALQQHEGKSKRSKERRLAQNGNKR